MTRSPQTLESWEAIGRKWVNMGRLWEAQDAYERAGKDLGLEELVAIGGKSLEEGRLNEAHASVRTCGG